MRALLDTHVLLWAAVQPSQLSALARDVVGDSRNELLLSTASVLEVALKVRRRRLEMMPSESDLNEAIRRLGVGLLPVAVEHALRVYDLPPHHHDPFDLLLVAQSLVEGMPLISADAMLRRYDVEVLW